MIKSTFDFEPILPFADNHTNCPVQCELTGAMARSRYEKHVAEHIGESLVGASGQMIDDQIDAHVPPEVAIKIKKTFRTSVGEDMNTIDERIDEISSMQTALSTTCSGVLKMRAQKAGVTYTVAVCTSPLAYEPHTQAMVHMPAHIQTRTTS